MATARAQQLDNLAKQLPVANQQLATGLQEARKTQLQDTIKQARPGAGGAGAAEQLGTQQAQQAGQIATGVAEQGANRAQLVGQMGLQEQGRKARQAAFEQGIQESRVGRQLGEKLNALSSNAKQRILDDNLKFKIDEGGRALLNTTQLADWAIMNAKSDVDLAGKMQSIEQAYNKKIQVMQAAANRLEQIAKQGYYSDKQKLDGEAKINLLKKSQDIKMQIESDRAKKASKLAATSGLFSAVGMGIGFVLGGPAGAALGGSVGGAVGTTYAGQSESTQKKVDPFLFTPSSSLNEALKRKVGI